MSWINAGWASLPEIPFGGVKNSGYGRELSEIGFTEFVNQHLVYELQALYLTDYLCYNIHQNEGCFRIRLTKNKQEMMLWNELLNRNYLIY